MGHGYSDLCQMIAGDKQTPETALKTDRILLPTTGHSIHLYITRRRINVHHVTLELSDVSVPSLQKVEVFSSGPCWFFPDPFTI